ncbi:protein eyes shut isoform X1 [Nasonia vitripennis]|uniref:Protein eyes shut n=1 Tax=Nasonia vitripennis TaxID=7425 RepID=A0A7M7GKG6_NASVI|nr:protein eyes shut isoform X1 [Nasonia vitripennis]
MQPRLLKLIGLQWHKSVVIIFVTLIVAACTSSDCSSNPCMYGICVDDPHSSYRCYCIDGYTGINCEINWDDCWSNPCLNGATCNDAIASYNCTCPEGFVGLNCEQKYSECMNHPCLNNGTCLDYNGFTCQCLEGFSGEFCEIDASVCNNTMCRNYGECVDGPGLTFTCRCSEGWTGRYCEEDVNECLASPCQNGGLCINVPGTYTCACLFGFTGKDCDKNVIPCDENPCQNNAVCLFEDAQPVCYCVPDYHGTFCESRYDDCESKYAHCANGGTCLDGINNFTCSCPPQYSGETCTVLLDITSTTTEMPTLVPEDQLTEKTIVPTEVTTATEVVTKEGTTVVGMTELFETTITSTTEEAEKTTVQETTDGADTTMFTETTKETFTLPVESRTEKDLDAFTTSKQDVTTTTTEKTTSTTIEETTFTVYTTTEKMVEVFPIQTPESRIQTTSSTTTTTKSVLGNDTTTQGFTISDLIPTAQSTTESTTTVRSTEESTLVTTGPPETTTTSAFTTDKLEGTTSSPNITEFTWTSKPIATSDRPADTDYDETIAISNSTAFSVTTSKVVTMLPSTIYPEPGASTDENTSQPVTTAETQTIGTTTAAEADFTTLTEFHRSTFGTDIDKQLTSIPVTTEYQVVHGCTKDQCANTTLCLYNATQCDCSYQNNCRRSPSIDVAAFNGRSYIRQKFMIQEGILSIFVRLKTRAKSGILIHALFDDERYALLYMETGQLKFQFSCGLQTMLFGELDSPVNNGHDVDVEMRFQYIVEQVSDKCSAKLLVNGSLVMSGEQVLQTHESIPQFARIHLGGIPVAFTHQFPQIVLGFIGCMSLLKVNDVKRDFIHDSVEAVQIEECKSFLCLSSPCKNFGACEEVDGKIRCKCVPGYSGETCERSVCDDNPCQLGATCLTSPGVSFLCICPLGTHGLLCEKDTTVMQPSFSIFAPGFSSYMAYGVSSSLKDNMELKLRIIPQTLEQISLIAYMGQTGGSKRDTSDHFSITYVRGYLMLTWDLGSGVRRIFTNTPLNVRAHKVHTLQIGRRGRDSWLYVEGIGNVTGRAAGSNTRLDVSPILYIGGHKSKYFQTLPHDLPLHTGFSGCIYDIELRTDDNVFPVTMSSPATGRGVGECHRNECSHHSCKNGAVCLNYGPTYSCICMKDWEGPDCSSPVNCTSNSLCH